MNINFGEWTQEKGERLEYQKKAPNQQQLLRKKEKKVKIKLSTSILYEMSHTV